MNTVSKIDDHGASQLPRTGAMTRALIAIGINKLNPGELAASEKRFANLPTAQRDAMRYFASGEVPSVNAPTGTSLGQAQVGLAVASLLGKIRGAIDLELNTSVAALAAADVSGAVIHAPGNAIPLISSTFKNCSTAAVKAAAIIAVSRALLEQPTAEPALNAILVRAATKAADAEFVRLALNGASATATGANDPAQLLAQVNAMGAALVAGGADPRFIELAANPSTLLQLACASTSIGTRAFPDVTVSGGTLAGMPLHASLGVATGRIVAIAGDSVVRSSAPPRIEASVNATIEHASDPTGQAEPGVTPVSATKQRVGLFQADIVALKIVAAFGVDFMRTTRAAYIDGISLAGDTTA